MTGTPSSSDAELPRSPRRTLLILLVAQILIGAALLAWVALGRPVPGLAESKANGNALAPRANVDRFDSARAWRLLVRR